MLNSKVQSSKVDPVSLNERADIIDVLRGFAILGIFFNNIIDFSGYDYDIQDWHKTLSTYIPDTILNFLQVTLVEGKFLSLFSLLFGIGFSIILIRSEQKGINPLKFFYRRLLILLLLGAVHLFLLWPGDVLFLYALVGLLLPLFRKYSDKALLIWAIVLIFAGPLLIDGACVILKCNTGAFLNKMAESIDEENGISSDEDSNAQDEEIGISTNDDSNIQDEETENPIDSDNEESGWREWRNELQSGFIYRYAYIIESNMIPKVLGMFLLGFYVGRKRIYANLKNYTTLLKKIRRWGFIIGIPASIAFAWIEGEDIPNVMGLLDTFIYAISVVPLSLAYISAICLYWIKAKGNTKWKLLAPVGRMALTNYLMQTIVCIIIFYNVGFGIGGNMGLTISFPIAIGIYILQIIGSNWWFRYFNYGPLEWIWRQLTYWKKLSIIKVSKES